MQGRDKKHSGSTLLLKNLIEIEKWQKIQNNFSAVTNIGIRTVDAEGNLIALRSEQPTLCKELLRCRSCLPTFLGGREVVDKNLSFICAAKLHTFIVPLGITPGKILGYIVVGPVTLVMRRQKDEYRQIAEEFNVGLDEFWNAFLEIKVISFHAMQSIIELIRGVGEYTIKLAYNNMIKERGVIMPLDSAKLNKLLDVLLDVAFEISQADIGSVMFFDETQENLTIRASRGIPEEIVSNTRVKLGEGISGIAAKEGSSFLIDGGISDNRIRPYLRRPYISSSMVLPLKIENRVMGVMNLGAIKTSPIKFDMDKIKLMNKLISLTTAAITSVK